MIQKNRILDSRCALVVAPHTDDEFGCAGTIIRLVAGGTQVHYLSLSRCEESVPNGFEKDVLESECRMCTKMLGIEPENVIIKGYRVRNFLAHRQEILEDLVALNRDLKPDLVLIPSLADTHQDHDVICKEGFRAFKTTSILGYELPQNTISFVNTAFVTLSEENISKKIEALSCYKSQAFRPYSSEKFIRSLAHVRGVQAGTTYAEAFEVIRLVLR